MKLAVVLLRTGAVFCSAVSGMAQGTLVDIDGNQYPTVVIGSQEWMASDLRTTKYSNGDVILNGQDLEIWFNASGSQTGAYCILNNDTAYGNQRGKIYNGHVVYDSRNVCPSGWRVPNDSDFIALEAFIGMPEGELYNEGVRGSVDQVGVKLKSQGILQLGTGLWDLSSTTPGSDLFGWNGYPHGARLAGGDFCCDNGSVGYLCKDSLGLGVLRRELSFNVDGIIRFGEPLSNGHQIRCIKEPCVSVVYETVLVYDTVLVSVADTLIINTNVSGMNPPNNFVYIKIYPNPANTHVTIDYGDFTLLDGYQVWVENSLGQTVFQTEINQQSNFISLDTWTGDGLYFVNIIDNQGNTVAIKKILIQ